MLSVTDDQTELPPCDTSKSLSCSVEITCRLLEGKDSWFFYVTNRGNLPVEYNITTSLGGTRSTLSLSLSHRWLSSLALVRIIINSPLPMQPSHKRLSSSQTRQ